MRRPAGVRNRRHASRATSSAYFGVTMRLRAQKRATASGPARRGGGSGGQRRTSGFEATSGTTARIISRLARVTTPVLYHIEISHYNEKVRWALDYKGVAHRRKAPMPMLHMAWAAAMTRGQDKTFPILRLNGDTIADSTRIIERLEHDYPEPPLYPAEPDDRRRALELEEFFDEELAPHLRRAAFAEVTRDSESFAWVAAPPGGQARARRLQEPAALAGPLLRKRYGINKDSAERGPPEDGRRVRRGSRPRSARAATSSVTASRSPT